MGLLNIKAAAELTGKSSPLTKYWIHQDTKVTKFVTKQLEKQISELVTMANKMKPNKKLWKYDPMFAHQCAVENQLTWGMVGHLQQLRMRLKKRTEGRQLELL